MAVRPRIKINCVGRRWTSPSTRFPGVIIFFDNRFVFSEVLLIPLVDSTGLFIFPNFAENISKLLMLGPEQDSSGSPLLYWFPMTDILYNLCF